MNENADIDIYSISNILSPTEKKVEKKCQVEKKFRIKNIVAINKEEFESFVSDLNILFEKLDQVSLDNNEEKIKNDFIDLLNKYNKLNLKISVTKAWSMCCMASISDFQVWIMNKKSYGSDKYYYQECAEIYASLIFNKSVNEKEYKILIVR